MTQTTIIEAIMVLLLWSAAVYRIVLSSRLDSTVWRTSITICTISIALAATSSVYGDQTVNVWLGVPNFAILLTHLALTVTAASASMYVATLRQSVITHEAVWWRVAAAGLMSVIQVVSWMLAPVHSGTLPDFLVVWDDTNVFIFNVSFVVVIVAIAADTATFYLAQAAKREGDPARTISLSLTGVSCLLGAVVFALAGVGLVLRYAFEADVTILKAIFDTAYPYIVVILALGTLSLWAAPPMVDYARLHRHWRVLRPLWRDLVSTTPEVHLDVPVTGGPRQRLRVRLQRAIVEIHDALRVTQVSVSSGATLEELGLALRTRGAGSHAAVDVLDRADTSDDDLAQLLTLARIYSSRKVP